MFFLPKGIPTLENTTSPNPDFANSDPNGSYSGSERQCSRRMPGNAAGYRGSPLRRGSNQSDYSPNTPLGALNSQYWPLPANFEREGDVVACAATTVHQHGYRGSVTRSIAPAPTRRESWTRQAGLPALILMAVVVTLVVPQFFPADGGPTGFDSALGDHIHSSLGGHPGVYEFLVAPSNAYVVVPLLLGCVAWFAYRREWWAAGFMVVAPELAMVVNSLLLKPFWGRHLHEYLAYPSGHTVHLVAVVTALALVSESARVRVTVVVVTAVVLPMVLVGMVGLGYHHPTDVVGGVGAAVALVGAAYLPVRYRGVRAGRTGLLRPR